MEAEDGYKMETGGEQSKAKLEAMEAPMKETNAVNIPHQQIRMVEWLGEWDLFKRTLRSAALCSGTDSAVKLAEKLAKNQKLKDLNASDPNLVKSGAAQSRRLHAQLTLSLVNTAGPQQALLESGLEDDEDGVAMLVRLVKHFEYTTKELRIQELYSKWTHEALQPGEHPSLLHTRLLNVQRQLNTLGESLTQASMNKIFVSAVQGDGKLYESVIDGYERGMVMGQPQTIEQLLEILAIKHRRSHESYKNPNNVMTGLYAKEYCTHCDRKGHKEESCWEKHPESRPNKGKTRKKKGNIVCFKCNKVGHIKKECPDNREGMKALASLNDYNKESVIDWYMNTCVDSACQCRTVHSLRLLNAGTIQHINTKLKGVGGTVTLTHMGQRTIPTNQGTIQLNKVYYAEEMDYNLISVPALNKSGTGVVFDQNEAYIVQNGIKVHLREAHGLWALPELQIKRAMAGLRMQRGGSADAMTWHQRLGHPSDRKLERTIKNGSVPPEAAKQSTEDCRTCRLTQPIRRPVPKTAERSGKVTVQVDYMPVGQN